MSYVPPHARRRSKGSTTTNASQSTRTVEGAIKELAKETQRANKKCRSGAEAGVEAYEKVLQSARELASRCARGAGAISDADKAKVFLAETALEFSSEIERRVRRKPLSENSRGEETAANEQAMSLAIEALGVFESVSDSGTLERSNGVATALSRIAELEKDDARAAEALRRAVSMYDVVSTSIEGEGRSLGDALLALWNCADARLKLAERASERKEDAIALASYREALSIYERACGHCDANHGDDLGGFLYDWGCSLTSYAQFLAKCKNLDEAATAADASIEKLRSSSQFSMGAVEPLNALGDALQTKAEILQHVDTNSAEQNLRSAIEEAYGAALKLNGSDLNAHVGVGESNMALATYCVRRSDQAGATQAYRVAWEAYIKALALSDAGDPGNCEERFGVVYNAACAANRAGERDTARVLLQQLLTCGGTTKDVIDADADLQ